MNKNIDKLALIRPFKLKDPVTKHTIKVSVSQQYSVISVDKRNYYFVRETGEFDGTSTDLTTSCGVEGSDSF